MNKTIKNDTNFRSMVKKFSPRTSNPGGDIRSIFRPFNMNAMDDVRYEKN